MARPRRFERLTHSLEGCCSIRLSYGRTGVVYTFSKGLCSLVYRICAVFSGRICESSSIEAFSSASLLG